jgi:outer membrane protein
VASAGSARIDAAAALRTQEIVLRQLLGWEADRPLLHRAGFSPSRAGFVVDSLLAAAMGARPELKLAQDAESTAAVQARLAGLGDKPTVALGLAPGVKNGYFPNLDRLKLNWAASLDLELPVFDGHRTLRQVELARANLLAARARGAEIRRRVASEVEQAVAGAQASREKIENAQVQVERAEEAVAMAKTQYGAGVITNLDLLDAETARSEAKLVALRAKYDYVSSLTTLDKATGRKIW